MHHVSKVATFLVTIFSFFVFPAVAQHSTLTATSKFRVVGLDDQFTVVYTFSGAYECKFNVNFDDFTVTSGPSQVHNQETNLVKGEYVSKESTKWTFTLKPVQTGEFTIPVVIITDQAGKKVRSNELKIKVVPGSVTGTDQEQLRLIDNYSKLSAEIKKGTYPYIVSAGPVYYHSDSASRAADSIMQAYIMEHMASGIGLYTEFANLGLYYGGDFFSNMMKGNPVLVKYYQDELPRRYFTVKDTANVRDAIAVFYGLDKKSVYITLIADAKKWNGLSELLNLSSAQKFYYYTDYLSVEAGKQGVSHQSRKVYTDFSFNDDESRDKFAAFIKGYNYEIASKSGNDKLKLSHTLRLLRETTLERDKLYAMAGQLLQLSKNYGGTYVNMAIVNE